MKKTIKLCLFAVLSLSGQASLAVNNNDKNVLDFFQLYMDLNQRFDPALANYFSDDALAVVTKYGEDIETIEKIKGVKIKKYMVDGMKYAKASVNSDKYSNIRVKDLGDRQYLIQADRYSIDKCYMDNDFSLTVQRTDKNSFIIKNLTSSSVDVSRCKTSLQEDTPAKLQAIASMQNKSLPKNIFRGLTLEKIYADGLVINYQARMTDLTIDQVDVLNMRMTLEPMFINNACNNPEIKQELDKGVIMNQILLSKDNRQVFTIKVDKNSCRK